ncbi:hypothetical protein [Dolichospermum phage Dfl-JY45]
MASANDPRDTSTDDERGIAPHGSPTKPGTVTPLNRLAAAAPVDLDAQVERSALRPLGDVSLDEIAPDPTQPRKTFEREALADLAATIASHGVIQPITVRRRDPARDAGVPPGCKWILISGERRWRASAIAQRRVIPACERVDTDPTSVAEAALIENVQRADLNPIELADHLAELELRGRTRDQLAALLGGKSKGSISKLLSLRDLPNEAKRALREGRIQAGHGFLLVQFPAVSINGLIEQIEARSLSVRQLEGLLQQHKTAQPPQKKAPKQDADIKRLETRLGELLGTRISVQRTPKGTGELRISFTSNDVLSGILERIGYTEE